MRPHNQALRNEKYLPRLRPLIQSLPELETEDPPRYASTSRRPFLPTGSPVTSATLSELIQSAEKLDPLFKFGDDIDEVHLKLSAQALCDDEKQKILRDWLSRKQPCLFGRLAAKGVKGHDLDICWLTDSDIAAGETHISNKIQRARKQWKDRAAEGLSHGFLVMIESQGLAYCKPSHTLVEICQRIADLYLVEAAPVQLDTIYTEAMPLRQNAEWRLFKAGINIFYSGAHRSLNHDRRVPGGMLISVNSPGHLANSLAMQGLENNLETAVETIFDLALRSIGNGGIGDDRALSTSWHNDSPAGTRCPFRPERSSEATRYSASYHTDVLIPEAVTRDPRVASVDDLDIWKHLILDYITEERFSSEHVNYALFHGHPIPEEAKYFNPWLPRRAHNKDLVTAPCI